MKTMKNKMEDFDLDFPQTNAAKVISFDKKIQ